MTERDRQRQRKERVQELTYTSTRTSLLSYAWMTFAPLRCHRGARNMNWRSEIKWVESLQKFTDLPSKWNDVSAITIIVCRDKLSFLARILFPLVDDSPPYKSRVSDIYRPTVYANWGSEAEKFTCISLQIFIFQYFEYTILRMQVLGDGKKEVTVEVEDKEG